MIAERGGMQNGVGPLLSVRELSMSYRRRGALASESVETVALKNVSFELREGETLALVGPSGSGKSSLARCVVRLETPTAGSILYRGEEVLTMRGDALKALRKEIHLIFQDSSLALNPRFTVREAVAEPLRIHRACASGEELTQRVCEALDQTEIGAAWHGRRPRELSGGQRQRVAIARALVLRPKLIILDEALSSLDLSTQAQIANLLCDLQERYAMAYLYVTHDMRMAAALAHSVAVLEAGRVVHRGLPAEVLTPNLQGVS